MRFKTALCLFLVLLLPLFSSADNLRSFIDRSSALSAAAKSDLKVFPDADSVLLDDYEYAEYKPDGSGLRWDESYTKILTEKGRREARTLSLEFTLPYSRAHALLCEVIKPDGSVVAVDLAANSREMVDPSQMDSNIFNPNDKVLQVAIPELAIGDVVHWLTFTEDFKPRMERSWCSWHVLEGQVPILSYTVEIVAPDALPIVSKALKSPVGDSVSYSSKKTDGFTTHRWVARNVPQFFPEPAMPPPYTCVQRLLVSTIPDWQTVSRWYWNLCQPRLETVTPEMKSTVAELTKGLKTPDEKIRAIFAYVSQKIRYMGLTTENVSPGYEPHDVSLTFENKYGVCRDKAALLVAMLRLAGLEAFPVIIQVGPKKDIEVPLPYFNHAITGVLNPDGSYTLMDSTDETSAELLSAYLSNCSYLVARPEGDILRTTPIAPASENMMRISTKGALGPDGSLNASVKLAFDGINDNAYRGRLLTIKPEERRLLFESKLKSAIDGAVLKSLKISPENLQDNSVPLTAELEFSVKDILASGSGEALLPPPWLGGSFGAVNFILRGGTGLEKRRFPLVTDIACGVAETIDLDLGQGVGKPLSIPKGASLDSETLNWKQELAVSGDSLKASAEFSVKVVEFSPEQYLALREVLKTAESDRRKGVVFASASSARDFDFINLEQNVEYIVADSGSYSIRNKVKRKILTYAGTKRCSEIKLNYKPVRDFNVAIKATVMAPDGTVKTLGEKELNVMDAEWVASAPRYPAERTLVASLPGVAPGSVIETETYMDCKDRSMFSALEGFQTSEPLESKTVTIRLPESLVGKLRLSLAPDETLDGGRTLVWRARNVEALKSEDSLPPSWAFTRTLLASSGAWPSFSKSALEALRAAASSQKAAEAKAAELCAGAGSPYEKATRIRDFVAKSIREAGPSGFGSLPLSCLTPADRTLADGYGNSTDCAILLFALLKASGFEPEFLLASGEAAVPAIFSPLYYNVQPWLFSSPLVRAKVDGLDVIFNDTNQYDKLGATSHSGKFALDLRSALPGILSAASSVLENYNDTFWRVEVKPDGSASIERTMLFQGMSYGNVRQSYTEMTPEQLRRHHQELVSSIAQSARPEGPLRTDFSSYPGLVSFKVTVPDFAVRDGARMYFRLPGGGFDGFFKLRSENRSNPYFMDSRSSGAIRYSLILPEGFKHLQVGPEPFIWNHNGSTVEVFSDFVSGRFEVSCRYIFVPSLTPASAYGALKTLDSFLGRPSNANILLSE